MNTQKHRFVQFVLFELAVVFAYFSLDMPMYFMTFFFLSFVSGLVFIASFFMKDKEDEEMNNYFRYSV